VVRYARSGRSPRPEGKALADIGDMKEGGHRRDLQRWPAPVIDERRVLRRAFESTTGRSITGGPARGAISTSTRAGRDEARVATRIGVKGQPACERDSMVARAT